MSADPAEWAIIVDGYPVVLDHEPDLPRGCWFGHTTPYVAHPGPPLPWIFAANEPAKPPLC